MALTRGIEKAFLMLSMREHNRNSLWFLWVADPHVEPPEIVTLRFTRVVFGVFLQPFPPECYNQSSYGDIPPG